MHKSFKKNYFLFLRIASSIVNTSIAELLLCTGDFGRIRKAKG